MWKQLSVYRPFIQQCRKTDIYICQILKTNLLADNQVSALYTQLTQVVDSKNETSKPTMQSLKQLEVSEMRKPYRGVKDTFDFDDLVSKEPLEQFYAWFEEAKNSEGIMEANAMALATASRDGTPSVRMVLMKGIDKRGIVFYTNFLSQKAKELTENPKCSLMFYWEPLMKVVRIEGSVELVSDAESIEYFHSRPRDSQTSACVSQQSSLVQSRQILDDRNKELLQKYSDSNIPIPKPDYWGGFRVVPSRFEFWQGQTNRLHDRIVFRKLQDGEAINPEFTHIGINGWVYERLMP